jgi:hypothetical protein
MLCFVRGLLVAAMTVGLAAISTPWHAWASDSSTVKLTSSPNPSTFDRDVTFTTKVSGTNPTGAVTFFDGTNQLGSSSLDDSGVASLTTSSLSVGTHSVTAAYSGDNNNDPATSATLSQVVRRVEAIRRGPTVAPLPTTVAVATPATPLAATAAPAAATSPAPDPLQGVSRRLFGRVAYEPRRRMVVNEAQFVRVNVGLPGTQGLTSELSQQSSVIPAVLSDQVELDLQGPYFHVERLDAAVKNIPGQGDPPAHWSWNVTPLRTGHLRLTLSIYAAVQLPGEQPSIRDIGDKPVIINVSSVSVRRRLASSFGPLTASFVTAATAIGFLGHYGGWIRAHRKQLKHWRRHAHAEGAPPAPAGRALTRWLVRLGQGDKS